MGSAKEPARRLRARSQLALFPFVITLAIAIARIVDAQQASVPAEHAPTSADEPAVGNPEDYEVLRRLLGVAPLTPPQDAAAPEAAPAAAPAASGAGIEASGVSAPIAPRTKPVQPRASKSVAKKVERKAAVVAAPKAPTSPETAPAAVAAAPSSPPAAVVQAPAAVQIEAASMFALPVAAAPAGPDLPAPGQVVGAADFERYQHLLGPSLQWALLRGAEMRIGAYKKIPIEEARAAATQRYHDQVELTADRTDMRNYVAGIPFPLVQAGDADAAIKVIFNQQSRLIVDDMDARKMGCEIGSLSKTKGFQLERTFQIEHWRRLYYLGRMYHQPLPEIPNQEGIRYRELQYPLIEPFDLKGGGWNFIRYRDPRRLDDGWIYYPITRRVRRLSTAQRSQGIFGQDMDLDSYTGYAGNPAWMQWRLVGSKTMLASMHSDHVPVRWQAAPADFAADEPWEPREVWVVEGRSLLPEYAFARRVIYIDKESYLVPYTEIYDDHGKLWKALHQTWGFGTKVRADAGGRSFEEFYLPGYSMIDMQIDHVTRCELPLRTAVGDGGWYYNYGPTEGTVEAAFDIAGFLGETH